jgi:hypothetical protein
MHVSLLASAATRSNEIAVEKMVIKVQKANCKLWFQKTKLVTVVKRWFRREFGLNPPTRPSIYAWYKQLTQSGCLHKGNCSRCPPVSAAAVDSVWQRSVHSLQKFTRWASQELAILQPMVWKTVSKHLQLKWISWHANVVQCLEWDYCFDVCTITNGLTLNSGKWQSKFWEFLFML